MLATVRIASNAFPKSSIKSSVASTPIDTRISPSVIPSLFLSSGDIPESQCLHSAVQQETCMRVETAAQVVQPMLDFAYHLRTSNDRTRNYVRVSIQVFCPAVK